MIKLAQYRFGDIFEFIRNGLSVKQDKSGFGLPITRIETISDAKVNPLRVGYADIQSGDKDGWLLQNGDILFSHINSIEHVGKCAIYTGIPEKLIHGMNLLRLRIKSDIADSKFILYLLRSSKFRSQLVSVINPSVNQASVSITNLSNLAVSLPPLPEQKRIAAILDKADALREKRRQTIAKLDTLLQPVFLDMFGDPVTNPKGWRTSTFGDELEVLQYGPRFYNQAYSPDGVRIVRITDLDGLGNLNFEAMPRLEMPEADIKKYSLRQGDVIFARSGATVGKTAIIPANAPTSIAGAYFIIMRFKKAIEPLYARTVLANKAVQSMIASQSRQSAQQNFSGPSIRRLGLSVPPLDLQIRFRDFSAAVTKTLLAQKEHEKRIASLCDSLTQRAFNGELFTDHEARHVLHSEN